MKSLRSAGSFVAARAAVRNSGAPWKDGVSVSTERQAAPPLLIGAGQRRRIEVGADQALGRAGLLDLGDQREIAGLALRFQRGKKAARARRRRAPWP